MPSVVTSIRLAPDTIDNLARARAVLARRMSEVGCCEAPPSRSAVLREAVRRGLRELLLDPPRTEEPVNK